MNATELLADWDRQIAELTTQAENRRNNGMLESAALMRTQRDTLKQCAAKLRALVEAPTVLEAAAKDACGDINCDGQCAPQQAPRPMLINRVDLCTSAEDARREESLATPAQRRMAARFLRVDLHDLPGALIKRTSERLTAATPPQRQPLAPALLNAIDECTTSNAARDVLRNAQPADRRAVAKFLNIPANDLLDVITHRMSTRLQQAA